MILEIAVSNIEAALLAEKAGADRIELCDNLLEGGTTPSHAYIQSAIQKLSIPVFPIIRPRGGDFLYTDAEFAVMKKDIERCKDLGCKGVVIGLLLNNGEIDVIRTKALVHAAGTMEVTFHRAFDRCNDAVVALHKVMETGCKRILTSGRYQTAIEGIGVLQQLVELAKNQIIIMPGSGVRANNIERLQSFTKAKEFHSAAAMQQLSKMEYLNPNFTSEENNYQTVDTEQIKMMKAILNACDSIIG